MLKSLGIHRRFTWLIVFVTIGASYRAVLAQGTGCAGDVDADGDVDLLDYAEFSNCLSGPGGGSGGAGCACFDLDGDVDVDLSDFTLFSQLFTGPAGDCPPGQGQADCGGGCIDVWWDENNCGACGNQCAPQDHCEYGSCATCGEPGPCYGGQLWCDGACREVQLDPANCGCCGHICDGDQYCMGGLCWYW